MESLQFEVWKHFMSGERPSKIRLGSFDKEKKAIELAEKTYDVVGKRLYPNMIAVTIERVHIITIWKTKDK